MNPDLKAKLEAALKAATDAGDMTIVHSLAAILKKEPSAPDGQQPPSEPMAAANTPDAPVTPPPADAEMVEPAAGPLYTAAQAQLEALYPGHEFEDELPDAVVICTQDDTGEHYLEITVTMNADGTVTLGEPVEVEPPADEPPIEPTEMMKTKRVVQAKGYVVDLGDKPPTEYRLWAYGTVETSKGSFLFTKEDAAAVIADIKTRGVELHFDYEHGTFSDAANSGQPIPAAGWYNVEARDDGLWLTNIRWTPTAAKMLEEREYRYLSPAFGVNETTNHIVSLENSALTNYPATRGIVALVEAKRAELEQVVTAKNAEIAKLKSEAFEGKLAANVKALENAGVPPAVLRLVRPILAADANATSIKLANGNQTTPGTALTAALLEFAKIGKVPKGTIIESNLTPHNVTLDEAVKIVKTKLEKEGKKNVRTADLYLMARAEFPHLKEPTT